MSSWSASVSRRDGDDASGLGTPATRTSRLTRRLTARRIGLVAWHVFKESVRDRVLYGIGAFALLLVAASVLIGQITAGQDVKIIKDLGLATIEMAGVLMTIFIGVGLVSREIDRRSIFGLLAKPLPRWEFIVGKYLGLGADIAVNRAAMARGALRGARLVSTGRAARMRVSWEAPAPIRGFSSRWR